MKNNCPICDAFSKEKIIYETRDFFVINAKTKKGHKQRYMFCSMQHVPHNPFDYQRLLIAVQTGLHLFKTDFVVFNGIYASIKQHWHVILSDRFFQDEVVDITKEPRIEVFR
ncbi:MAG: hypothetical protein LUO93_09010 [Methanomicrobiales archaeon]|nr:hypothetical protein [Methanomicrobiales archaeon]